MKIQAIIPMAGVGTRFKANLPKPLVRLNDKPLFVYALEIFEATSSIESVIAVVNETHLTDFEEIIEEYHLAKVVHVIPGGDTRSDSVFHGLQMLDDDTEGVLIHDGVRPFVTVELIEAVVEGLRQYQAIVTAVPLKPTIKKIDAGTMLVQQTLERNDLWEVQTPQAFHKEIIFQAHERFRESTPTDDAMMVEQLGVPVKVAMGDYRNIKITTSEDLILAEAFLSIIQRTS